jgi:C4-dicarboxylate-binding protein DctP
MKLSIRAWTAVLVLSLFAASAVAQTPGMPNAPIVIKFGRVIATDTPNGKGAGLFKQLAEERTRGRAKVEVDPDSTRYKDKEA